MTVVGWSDLRREPYRVLFPLGMLFGCLGVGRWLGYALGHTTAALAWYHASVQLGAYLYCFIAGFLWTAMPRMTGTAPASTRELLTLLALVAAQTALLAAGHSTAAQACFAGLLLLLAAFALRRLLARRGEVRAPVEFMWVPIGVAFGLAGSGLLVAGLMVSLPAWVGATGRVMAQQGFALSIVVGIGGFMAPRLMGRSFDMIVPPSATQAGVRRGRARRRLVHAAVAAGLAGSFVLEGLGHIRGAYLLRAALVTGEFAWLARWWQLPSVQARYVQMVWLSLWFLLAGLWGAALWPQYRIAMLHLLLIGGFSLMIAAVATMVVLSHGGQGPRLRQPLWVLDAQAAALGGATALRVAADLWPQAYFGCVAGATLLWLTAAVSWLVFAVPHLVRRMPDETFERFHEAARRGLQAAC
jgi:uncharacterized protein involved in response to NO